MVKENIIYHTKSGTKFIFSGDGLFKKESKGNIENLVRAIYLPFEEVKVLMDTSNQSESFYNSYFYKKFGKYKEGGHVLYHNQEGKYRLSTKVEKVESSEDDFFETIIFE